MSKPTPIAINVYTNHVVQSPKNIFGDTEIFMEVDVVEFVHRIPVKHTIWSSQSRHLLHIMFSL